MCGHYCIGGVDNVIESIRELKSASRNDACVEKMGNIYIKVDSRALVGFQVSFVYKKRKRKFYFIAQRLDSRWLGVGGF